MKNTVFPHKFWRPFLDCTSQLFFRPQYVWFLVHLKGHLIPLCYETLVVNWQNWLFTLFHQSRSVLSPNPIENRCYRRNNKDKKFKCLYTFRRHFEISSCLLKYDSCTLLQIFTGVYSWVWLIKSQHCTDNGLVPNKPRDITTESSDDLAHWSIYTSPFTIFTITLFFYNELTRGVRKEWPVIWDVMTLLWRHCSM